MMKIWNSDPEDICGVDVEENPTWFHVETKVFSSANADSLKSLEIEKKKQECQKSVMADYVVEEFKKAVKTCRYPTKATMKTSLITLFLGVFPSLIDLFSELNLGLSYIMNGDYGWGGKECLTLLNFK